MTQRLKVVEAPDTLWGELRREAAGLGLAHFLAAL